MTNHFGFSFKQAVTLGECEIDGDIWVSSSKGGTGTKQFHINDECSHKGETHTKKDPATQFNDLTLCNVCRLERIESMFPIGGKIFRATKCTFEPPETVAGETLECPECEWAIEYEQLPMDHFGYYVAPTNCPKCEYAKEDPAADMGLYGEVTE